MHVVLFKAEMKSLEYDDSVECRLRSDRAALIAERERLLDVVDRFEAKLGLFTVLKYFNATGHVMI